MVKDRLDAELVGNVSLSGADHRAPRHLGGAGPRRAGPGDPRRADAPRGLRADRRQAAGGDQGDRRQGARADGAADHRRPRGVPRHDHRAARRPQGPDGADDQPRHGLGADGVPRPGPRPDRLPHRVPDRHPRHGHRPPHQRGLRAVGRRDPLARLRLAGGRPDRRRDGVRDDQPAGARHPVRGADHRGLRGHDRRRELPRRRHGRQHHQGEAADQHPLRHLRQLREARPAAPAQPRAVPGVLPRGRVRRGHPAVRADPQGGPRPARARQDRPPGPARAPS